MHVGRTSARLAGVIMLVISTIGAMTVAGAAEEAVDDTTSTTTELSSPPPTGTTTESSPDVSAAEPAAEPTVPDTSTTVAPSRSETTLAPAAGDAVDTLAASAVPSCDVLPPSYSPPTYCNSGVIGGDTAPALPECPPGLLGERIRPCIRTLTDGRAPAASFPSSIDGNTGGPFTINWNLPDMCDFTKPGQSYPCLVSGWSPLVWVFPNLPEGIVIPQTLYSEILPADPSCVAYAPSTCQWTITPDKFGYGSLVSPGTAVISLRATVAFAQTEWVDVTAQGAIPVRDGGTSTPPTASFAAEEQSTGSLTWLFDGSGSTATGATITKWDWNFGHAGAEATATGKNVNHTFPAPGVYDVTLTVTDSNGQTNSLERTLSVALPITVNSTADTANAPASGKTCDTGNTVGPSDDPECTLRAALQAANAGGGSSIEFDVPAVGVPDIALTDRLPRATVPLKVNGASQPGGFVQLSSTTNTFDALQLDGANSEATGLVFKGFNDALRIGGRDTEVTGNRFGTTADGKTAVLQPNEAIVTAATLNTEITDNVITAKKIGVHATSSSTGTVADNRIGVSADKKPLDPATAVGVSVDGAGVWTVSGNTLRTSQIGVILRGGSATGSRVNGNHVGNASGTTLLGSTGVGIWIDGVPGAEVGGNVVTTVPDESEPLAVRIQSVDIVVTGMPQNDPATNTPPSNSVPVTGVSSGGGATVSSNTVGVLADGTTSGAGSGINVIAEAHGVEVSGNHVAGHIFQGFGIGKEIGVSGADRATIENNRIGTTADQRASIASGDGVDLSGADDTKITNNTISPGERESAVLLTRSLTDSGPGSLRTTIAGNRIGISATGADVGSGESAYGVSVWEGSEDTTIGPGNVISNLSFGTGVSISGGTRTTVTGNRIGTNLSGSAASGGSSNQNGIRSFKGDEILIDGNVVGGGADGISLLGPGTSEIRDNYVGRAQAGQSIPNRIGIEVDNGTSYIHGNKVENNGTQGIDIRAAAKARLRSNFTWNNRTGLSPQGGLAVAGGPPAPTVAVVQAYFGSEARRWIVVESAVEGTLELFANPYCANEGFQTQLVRKEFIENGTTAIYAPTGEAAGGITATITTLDGTTSSMGFKQGRTSNYSTCATPTTYPDTSGTGIPDIIQTALGGDPSNPKKVVFPSDEMNPVTLFTSEGRFVEVRPVTRPGPPGLSFPVGIFSFKVTDLPPGGRTLVGVDSEVRSLGYWRFGPLYEGGTPTWYPFDYLSQFDLGAEPVNPSTFGTTNQWILHLQDGQYGDDDFTENGTIVDPGAPANGEPTGTTPTTTPTGGTPANGEPTGSTPTTAQTDGDPPSTPTTDATDQGTLPRTGGNPRPLVALGVALIAAGIGVLSGRRRLTGGSVSPHVP